MMPGSSSSARERTGNNIPQWPWRRSVQRMFGGVVVVGRWWWLVRAVVREMSGLVDRERE
jgi:hypothetical protein